MPPLASCREKEWVRCLGASPPMRMSASWFGSWTHRIQGCGAIDPCPESGLPSDRHPRSHQAMPSCSELSRCGLARLENAARLARRPTLTAPARAGFAMLRVGVKKRDPRSNKETNQERCRAEPLDFEGPIQGGPRSIRRVTTRERVRLEGACHLWREVPSRQLSIDLEADERCGRVTGRAEAS